MVVSRSRYGAPPSSSSTSASLYSTLTGWDLPGPASGSATPLPMASREVAGLGCSSTRKGFLGGCGGASTSTGAAKMERFSTNSYA